MGFTNEANFNEGDFDLGHVMGVPPEKESSGDMKEVDDRKGVLLRRSTTLQQRMDSARQISLKKEPTPQSISLLKSRKVIYPGMKNRAVLDAFRELRTKLLQVSNGENFVVLLTAVEPHSGTSFCTLNLAAAFALDDTKTSLAVDCNLRNPVLHKRIGIGKGSGFMGLTDYIETPNTLDPEEGLSVEDIIYPTGVKRLSVVPVGHKRETSSEYVASAHMEAFFVEVRERYPDRFIFVDAPSISESPDARVLADLCDMVVLCVTYGQSTKTQIARVAAEFGDEKLAGVIFTEGGR